MTNMIKYTTTTSAAPKITSKNKKTSTFDPKSISFTDLPKTSFVAPDLTEMKQDVANTSPQV